MAFRPFGNLTLYSGLHMYKVTWGQYGGTSEKKCKEFSR